MGYLINHKVEYRNLTGSDSDDQKYTMSNDYAVNKVVVNYNKADNTAETIIVDNGDNTLDFDVNKTAGNNCINTGAGVNIAVLNQTSRSATELKQILAKTKGLAAETKSAKENEGFFNDCLVPVIDTSAITRTRNSASQPRPGTGWEQYTNTATNDDNEISDNDIVYILNGHFGEDHDSSNDKAEVEDRIQGQALLAAENEVTFQGKDESNTNETTFIRLIFDAGNVNIGEKHNQLLSSQN